MTDQQKSKDELIRELETLRERVRSLQREQPVRVLDELPDGFIAADPATGRCMDVNPAICRMLGYSREELLQMKIGDLQRAEDLPALTEAFGNQLSGQPPLSRGLPLRHRDGSQVWADMHGIRLTVDGVPSLAGMFRDVTEERAREAVRIQSETQLQTTLAHADLVLFNLDRDGTFLSSAGKGLAPLGLEANEAVGESVFQRYKHLPKALAAVRRALAGEETHDSAKTGGRAFDCHFRPVLDDTGNVSGVVGLAIDMTERLAIERTLRESEERYRLLVEDQSDLIVRFDLDLRVQYANPNYCTTFGVDQKQFLGQTFASLIHDADQQPVTESLRRALLPPYRSQHEERARTSTGWRWFSWCARAMLNGDGEPEAIVSVGRDIHERKLAERALQKSQALLQAAMDHSQTGILISDAPDGHVAYVNRAGREILGWELDGELDEAALQRYGELWVPRTIDGTPLRPEDSPLSTAFATGEPNSCELILRRPDGEDRVLWIHVAPVFGEEGVVSSGFIVFLDVTARRETELALATSEERLSVATQSAGLGIWHLDLADNRLTWDDRMHQLYGTNPETFQGTHESWRRAVHPDDLAEAEARMREAMAGPGDLQTTFRAVHPDGKLRYIDAYASVQRDQDGMPLAMTGVNWDSTDRVVAEQRLRDSREEFRRLFTTMLSAFALHEIILDDEGNPCDYRFLQINPAFERITGMSAQQAVGHTVRELIPGIEPAWIERYGNVAIKGEPTHFEQFSRELNKHFQVTAYCPRRGQFACVFQDVTKRIQDTKALRESEERFREIIQNLASGVAFLSPINNGEDFLIRRLNPAASHFHGYDQQPHVGRSLRESLPQLGHTGLFDALARVWRSGVAERLPVVGRDTEGISFWIETFICRLELGEIAAVFEDRTEQHRYQEEVEAREQQLRSIFAAAPVGIGLLKDRVLVTVNDQFCHMIGWEREELIGKSTRTLYASSEEYERVGHEKYAQIRDHGTGSLETRFLRKEGAMIDVILSSTPLDRDDWSKGVTFTALDITKRKRTERQIQLETEVLESLNSPAPQREIVRKIAAAIRQQAGLQAVGIRLRNGDDFPYYHTDGFPEGLDTQRSHLVQRDGDGQPLLDDQGQIWMACLCGAVIQGHFELSQPFITQGGSFWTNSLTRLRAESVVAACRLSARQECALATYESLVLIPLRSEGKTIGLLQLSDERPNLFTPDVIEFYEGLGASIGVSVARERDAEALRRNEERLHEILDAVGAGVIAVDAETARVTYANPAAASLLHTSREALLGLARQAVSPSSPMGDDGAASAEADLTTRDGQLVPVLRTVSRAELNGRDCLLESFIDLTAQRRAEEEQQLLESRLRQSQRLEAIGTLAGGIAHDFNNILYAVLGFAELALDDCPSGSDASDNIGEVIRAGNRAKEIVNQILTFSRQTEQEKLPLRLQSVIEEVGKLIRSSMPSSIALEVDLDPDCPPVLADPSQMHQVAMNLCTNAYQAMREAAQAPGHAERDCLMHLALRQRDLTAADARQMPGLQPGPHVEFTVHDTGPGIPPELLEHIFEPYFTTKTKERGTGLGLAIVQGIVSSHNGAITIESRGGDGTTCRVLLPASEEVEEIPFTPRSAPSPTQSAQKRILFVDDEAPLRQLAEIALGNLGYVVTTASDGRKALEILRREADGLDLLITDLTMPGMSGIELTREVLQTRPDLPILLCTGHGEAITREQAIAAGVRELMMKPILPSDLVLWVGELLHPLAPN